MDKHYYADGANSSSAGSAYRPTAAAPDDLLNLFDGLGVAKGALSSTKPPDTQLGLGCADGRQKEKRNGKENEKGKKAEKSRHARPCRTAAKQARTAGRRLSLCRLLMAELPSALLPHLCKLGRVRDSVGLRCRSLRWLRLRRGNGACSVEDILGLGSMSTVQTHVAKPVASRPKASSVLHHLVPFEHFRKTTTTLPIARIFRVAACARAQPPALTHIPPAAVSRPVPVQMCQVHVGLSRLPQAKSMEEAFSLCADGMPPPQSATSHATPIAFAPPVCTASSSACLRGVQCIRQRVLLRIVHRTDVELSRRPVLARGRASAPSSLPSWLCCKSMRTAFVCVFASLDWSPRFAFVSSDGSQNGGVWLLV